MARLVVLTEGLKGQSCELKVGKTTIGRVDDNVFQLTEPSVSSHHCEVFQQGSDFVVKDLNSTNGTFINGEKISESVLKPGQVLRVGQVELRLENGAPAAEKKPMDRTRAIGVKSSELETGSKPVFDKNSPFAKKSNKTAMIFITIGILLGAVIVVSLILALKKI